MSKHSYWPPPVAVARFRDGETVRMSFWSQEGKPIDAARGHRLVSWAKGAEPVAFHVEMNGVTVAARESSPSPRVNWAQRAREARQALTSGNIAVALALLEAA